MDFWSYVLFVIICITCPVRICLIELMQTRQQELVQQDNQLGQVQVEIVEDYSQYLISVNQNNIDQTECIICYEEFSDDTVSLRCGHFYHRDCINNWLDYKDSCPICRRNCRF